MPITFASQLLNSLSLRGLFGLAVLLQGLCYRHNDKLKEPLIKCFRRVASPEFSPAFQSREECVECLRRLATPETSVNSIVATRPEKITNPSRR
jgi:hypothetical protein